jgi:hypothetical protein
MRPREDFDAVNYLDESSWKTWGAIGAKRLARSKSAMPEQVKTSLSITVIPLLRSESRLRLLTRGSTLLVRVENVVLRLHGHMARVSAV